MAVRRPGSIRLEANVELSVGSRMHVALDLGQIGASEEQVLATDKEERELAS
ncbi:hypothetical protein MA16_Dca028692 [Dendrobium catenatum]|uniref:Uncharacterized protein n=1 Tax=Dendrobium catenatum TaxID=906689 RepID=A0A2I0VDN8_9ASPA|nr:hypothetical protein MA16_Dca028692 [Dendrobium catenatum]